MSNNLLILKGKLSSRKNTPLRVFYQLGEHDCVSSRHVRKLVGQLENIIQYWEGDTLIDSALVSVYYNSIVSKSKRLIRLLREEENRVANNTVCGARFESEQGRKRHVITHCLSISSLKKSLSLLRNAADIIDTQFDGFVNKQKIESVKNKWKMFGAAISVSLFKVVIYDVSHVADFKIDRNETDISTQCLVTLYETRRSVDSILESIGINPYEIKRLDELTLLLTPEHFNLLKERASYLIAMQVEDIAKITDAKLQALPFGEGLTIPAPDNEPVVGVIDTLFATDVYFSEWVTYEQLLNENIPVDSEDYRHGTGVSSIIVDGPSFNPDLEDGCGRFRVKHFGVATAKGFSSFSILKTIRRIVQANPEIRVWNLSLGSNIECPENFISPEGAELDKIQNEYNVIFIVAGTNKSHTRREAMRVGAPADSLNALVVNSVKGVDDPRPASYSRSGPVLSFFNKPDVSYCGGDSETKSYVAVCSSTGEMNVCGTSYAAPWVTRKVAYLIYIAGLSREAAKALIIDSAAGWNHSIQGVSMKGYGVVPQHIREILTTKDSEIRFIIEQCSREYETFTHEIPVPSKEHQYPFIARATLCYFPDCSRNQGVDYPNTELDIQFGRVHEAGDKVKIESLNKNRQGEMGDFSTEEDARHSYRKWDNVKHMCDRSTTSPRPRKQYGNSFWGLSIKMKERLSNAGDRKKLPFAVVVTLKEINGENKCGEFIQHCQARGWLVQELDIDVRLQVYLSAEQDFNLSN